MSEAGGDLARTVGLGEMARWLGAPVGRRRAEEIFRLLNDTVRSVFVYRISGGEVVLLDKPAFKVLDPLHAGGGPADERGCVFLDEVIRARMYRAFIERVLAAGGASVDTVIAIDVNDAPIAEADAPVFAFQKARGDRSVLLPDIDFLHSDFYIDPQYCDDLPYMDKKPKGVFAGATTGGRTITAQDVRALAIPRLRAGAYFRGSDLVDFRLAKIVQCESPEVERMIAELGVDPAPCTWAEQFGHRLILSMDGNGATCSRVAIGLASRSALVKYDSGQQLYYFGAMLPWRHFIPVRDDEEAASLVRAERRQPGLFEEVAEEGRRFARRHLSRAAVRSYMLELLKLQESALAERPGRGASAAEAAAARVVDDPPLVAVGAHIQGIGDVWGWPGDWVGKAGSGRAIEAIMLAPRDLPREAFALRAVLEDGSPGPWSAGAAVCGVRGEDRPLTGFEVMLREPWASSLCCGWSASFLDGAKAGPFPASRACRSGTGAALDAIEIRIAPRAAAP